MMCFHHLIKQAVSLAILMTCIITSSLSYSCSRILKSDDSQAVMVGRTMDWGDQTMETRWWVYPRGMERTGFTADHTVKWTSRYGSIVTTAYQNITTDGINEQGFAAHILWLDESDYGKRNEMLPSLSVIMWAQYYLDHFKTVDEAVRFSYALPFQITPFYHPKAKDGIKVHLALEDATGDSAIIEYVHGLPHIYHHRSYTVLTNSPTYDQQLRNLYHFDRDNKTLRSDSDKPLPGTTNSVDRFIRAAFYLKRLPQPSSIQDEITGLQSVLQNVAQPFGAPSPERNDISPTLWRVITDLTHKVYYFNSATSLNMVWVELDKLDFKAGAPVMKLELSNNDLTGNVFRHFRPVLS